MYTPVFPYEGNQVLITSDRVQFLSKKDSIILFSNKSIWLSSIDTVNIDSSKKIKLDCDKIELGHQAEVLGQPVVLGKDLVRQLELFTQKLSLIGKNLKGLSGNDITDLNKLSLKISLEAEKLENASNELNRSISTVLSNNTYTR